MNGWAFKDFLFLIVLKQKKKKKEKKILTDSEENHRYWQTPRKTKCSPVLSRTFCITYMDNFLLSSFLFFFSKYLKNLQERTWKYLVLWVLSRISNKDDIIGGAMWFVILYISVIKSYKFLWRIVILLWFDKRDLKSVNWSL